MEILFAFLTVLKFIAIMFVVIVGILLFFVTVALFGGIRYYVIVEKKESFYVNVKLSFIKIINFVFLIDKDVNRSYFKILFFKFFKKDFAGKENSDKEVKIKNKENFNSDNSNYDKSVCFEECEKYIDKDFSGKNNNIEDFFSKEDCFEKKNGKKKYHYNKKVNNIFSFVKNIYNKFIYLKNYPEKGEIVKYTLRFVKELIFAIKPKKFKANITIGFEDPSNTGKFLGISAVILEFLPLDIYLSGDFENEIFEGILETKGKTSVFKIGIPTLRYIFKKPIWRLIKRKF